MVSTNAVVLLTFMCTVVVALTTGSPTPPRFASRFVSVGDRSIPGEGTSYQQTIFFDGERGMQLVNKSTPNGWYATLEIVNHTDTTNSHVYMVYLINDVVTCYTFTAPFGHIPTPQLHSSLAFVRKGIRAAIPRDVYRKTVGKYVLTAMIGVQGDTVAVSLMDMMGCAATEDTMVRNNATIDASVFPLPAACTGSENVGTGEKIHETNWELVGNHRANPSLYQFKTREDLIKRIPQAEVFSATDGELSQLPASLDNRRFATPVRDQAMCGGCWAFSSVAASEIAFNKANNITIPTGQAAAKNWGSVQNILDCAHGTLNGTALIIAKGCLGGWPLTALMYIVEHGIHMDPDYSFDGVTGSRCRQVTTPPTFPLSNAMELPVLKSKAGIAAQTKLIMAAVAKHGAVVAIINVLQDFEFYGGGIYNNPQCTPSLQHAVTVVGYGTEDGNDYWLIKNSLGGNWGEGGYIRMAKGVNMCGVEDFGFVPIGAST